MRDGQRPSLILFDLDGTLVDSFEDIRAGVAEACRAIEVVPDEPLLRLSGRGVALEEFFRQATGCDPDADAPRFACFVDGYRRHYLPGCLATTRPYPGIPEALAALRRGGAKLAIATTKRTDTAERVVEGTGLAPLLDAVAGSDGLPHKPDPAVLRRAAERAGVPLERAVMVGDTDRDVLAAKAAGIPAIAVTWGGFSEEELVALQPDHLVRRVAELAELFREGR